jgi:RNA recognition motif-containing protein
MIDDGWSLDKVTQAPKGSAFIKYSDASSASNAISAANDDPILVKDRPCRVDLAVNRDRAQLFTSQQKLTKDKRNLYLSNEGMRLVASEEIE